MIRGAMLVVMLLATTACARPVDKPVGEPVMIRDVAFNGNAGDGMLLQWRVGDTGSALLAADCDFSLVELTRLATALR